MFKFFSTIIKKKVNISFCPSNLQLIFVNNNSIAMEAFNKFSLNFVF